MPVGYPVRSFSRCLALIDPRCCIDRLTDSVTGATILISTTGFSWAITQWAPFSLVCFIYSMSPLLGLLDVWHTLPSNTPSTNLTNAFLSTSSRRPFSPSLILLPPVQGQYGWLIHVHLVMYQRAKKRGTSSYLGTTQTRIRIQKRTMLYPKM